MVPQAVRIKFTKTGNLQFISHLDLNRTMKSALIRAKVPIWYSEGFNPHPKLVFALPLSIGTESVCEFMDIKLVEEMTYEQLKARLGEALTDEMKILEVYQPESKFTQIQWAEYQIHFAKEIDGAAELFSKPLVVTKRTKSGEREIDILPFIKSFTIAPDSRIIRLLLSADSENYLNPEYVAAEISKTCNVFDYGILRCNVYTADGITPFR